MYPKVYTKISQSKSQEERVEKPVCCFYEGNNTNRALICMYEYMNVYACVYVTCSCIISLATELPCLVRVRLPTSSVVS